MRFLLISCIFSLAPPVFSQLDVGDQVLPETVPTAQPTEDVPVDQDAVRALTRRASSLQNTSGKARGSSANHPGRDYFQQVMDRLRSAPEHVQVIVRLQNGQRASATLQNVLINIHTAAGPLPVQWNEIKRMEKEDDHFTIDLQTGGTLSGTLTPVILHLTRDDASEWMLPAESLMSLRILPEK